MEKQIAQSYPEKDLEKDGFFPRYKNTGGGYDEAIVKTKDESDSLRVSPATELFMLVTRELQNLTRDKASVILRLGITIFIQILQGVIFWNVGASDLSNPQVRMPIFKLYHFI